MKKLLLTAAFALVASHAYASTGVYDPTNPWVGVNPYSYPNPKCVIYKVEHYGKGKCDPMKQVGSTPVLPYIPARAPAPTYRSGRCSRPGPPLLLPASTRPISKSQVQTTTPFPTPAAGTLFIRITATPIPLRLPPKWAIAHSGWERARLYCRSAKSKRLCHFELQLRTAISAEEKGSRHSNLKRNTKMGLFSGEIPRRRKPGKPGTRTL